MIFLFSSLSLLFSLKFCVLIVNDCNKVIIYFKNIKFILRKSLVFSNFKNCLKTCKAVVCINDLPPGGRCKQVMEEDSQENIPFQ